MAREVICGIYKITNLVNGKVYIGQSKDIYKRWTEHKRAKGNSCPLLYNSIRKHGIDNFHFEIQEICLEKELNEKEIFWIKYYKSCIFFEGGWGYNCNEGGSEGSGYIPSEDTRKLMSKIKIENGTWRSRPVICEGIEFRSVSECARYYDVKKSPMSAWLDKRVGMPDFFVKNKLRYKDKEFSYKKRKYDKVRRNIQVCIDEKLFNSLVSCAEYLNVNSATLKYWLDIAMPKEMHNRGLKYFNENYKTTNKISKDPSTKHYKNKIIFNGEIFNTITELSEAIGCNSTTIYRFIKTKLVPKKLENTEFIFNGEKFDTTPKIKVKKSIKSSKCRPVYFDGIIYNSLQELADNLGRQRNTVKYWFDKNKLPKEYGDIEFYYLKGGENGCEKK